MSNRRKIKDPARGLVEVFLTETTPAKVGLELYPPDRESVELTMLASEAAALAQGIAEAAAECEKVNNA